MTRALFTGSSYSRVKSCPASAAFPHVASSNMKAGGGDVFHEHMRLRVVRGIDDAVAAIPQLCAKYRLTDDEAAFARSKCMGFEWTPPHGALCEVSLALFSDGHVERIAGGRGEYDLPDGAIFAATIDVLWADPVPLSGVPDEPDSVRCLGTSVLFVGDYKSGKEEYVEQVEHNGQIRTCALLAARWTGAKIVMPALIFPNKGPGVWDSPEQPLGPSDLDAIEQEIRATYAAAQAARQMLDRGEVPPLHESHHCGFCPAQMRCPAKVAMIRSAIDGTMLQPAQVTMGLTPHQAARVAAALPQLEAFVKRAKAVLRQIQSEQGDIDLGDGLVWGPHPVPKKVLDPDLGVEILAQEIGREQAMKAVTRELSQDAIKEAVKEAHKKAGIVRKDAPTVRRVMAKLAEQGGVGTRSETWYSAYRPRAVTEDGDDGSVIDAEIEEG